MQTASFGLAFVISKQIFVNNTSIIIESKQYYITNKKLVGVMEFCHVRVKKNQLTLVDQSLFAFVNL